MFAKQQRRDSNPKPSNSTLDILPVELHCSLVKEQIFLYEIHKYISLGIVLRSFTRSRIPPILVEHVIMYYYIRPP